MSTEGQTITTRLSLGKNLPPPPVPPCYRFPDRLADGTSFFPLQFVFNPLSLTFFSRRPSPSFGDTQPGVDELLKDLALLVFTLPLPYLRRLTPFTASIPPAFSLGVVFFSLTFGTSTCECSLTCPSGNLFGLTGCEYPTPSYAASLLLPGRPTLGSLYVFRNLKPEAHCFLPSCLSAPPLTSPDAREISPAWCPEGFHNESGSSIFPLDSPCPTRN